VRTSSAPIRDGDPRLTGRPFRHSRSRSRSPQRVARDNFRDNYNPYRDERRDERRDDSRRTNGPGFNRDRSFSPVIAARGGPPPFPQRGGFLGPGDRSPAYGGGPGGGGGGEEEYILIDSNLVGLIIGRQGENLRRVENETHTRVQFITGPDATGPKRQCKIRGTPQAREDAKAEITRIIEENGNPARGNVPPERLSANTKPIGGHQPALRSGEDAEQIMVPNRTVGLIIGRGGETIRDLQERSQCHVNIVGPEKSINGLRPVNLIGTPQAAAMAKDLIMEIVDSDTKSLAAQGGSQGLPQDSGPQSGGPGYGGFGGGGSGSDSYGDKINDTLMVPSESVGMIIGKGKSGYHHVIHPVLTIDRRRNDQRHAKQYRLQDQCSPA
jgi:far upstream element-binding protein